MGHDLCLGLFSPLSSSSTQLLTLNPATTGIDREDKTRQAVGNPMAAYDEMEGARRGLVKLTGELNLTTASRNQSRQVGYEDDVANRPRSPCRVTCRIPTTMCRTRRPYVCRTRRRHVGSTSTCRIRRRSVGPRRGGGRRRRASAT